MNCYNKQVLFAAFAAASSAKADNNFYQQATNVRLRGKDDSIDLPSQCGGGSTNSCRVEGGSCTPYPFKPYTQDYQDEPNWMDNDGLGFTTYAFVPYDENSYQAYQAESPAVDTWIVHGHDGAGVQATDCLGDWHYFEHFGPDIGSSEGPCDMTAQYPAQEPLNQCYFNHPGKETNFEYYNCGWWRGYNDAEKAGLYNAWGAIGVDAAGTNDATKDMAMEWLRNCWDNVNKMSRDCSMNTMDGAEKDGQYPVAYFVGTAFPWICDHTSEDTLAQTGVSNSKCYCDNEPWGGRNVGSTEPNHNMEILYCGKYENDNGMWCDYIKFGPEWKGAKILNHFWLAESTF